MSAFMCDDETLIAISANEWTHARVYVARKDLVARRVTP